MRSPNVGPLSVMKAPWAASKFKATSYSATHKCIMDIFKKQKNLVNELNTNSGQTSISKHIILDPRFAKKISQHSRSVMTIKASPSTNSKGCPSQKKNSVCFYIVIWKYVARKSGDLAWDGPAGSAMFYVSYCDHLEVLGCSILLIRVLHCQNQIVALYPQLKKPKTPRASAIINLFAFKAT